MGNQREIINQEFSYVFALNNLVKPFTVMGKTPTGTGEGGENTFDSLHGSFDILLGLPRDVK